MTWISDDLVGCDHRANYGGPKLANYEGSTRKALNLPLEDLFVANFAELQVNATEPGIHMADA